MKLVLILVIALVLSVTAIVPPDNNDSLFAFSEIKSNVFNTWKSIHSKIYETEAEEFIRFENFKKSLTRIAERNSKSSNPVFGLTKFSDLSTEEFKRGYVPRNSKSQPLSVLPGNTDIAVPATFDWRTTNKVTPVKDQGQCGSCWAFSVVENVESIYMIANNIDGNSMTPLSPQEIVDCDSKDSGCNGGDPPTAYAYIMSAGGLETDADYPYTATDGNTCNFDKSKVKVSISNWKYATTTSNEGEMQTALVNWGPLSICVDASPWQDYTGGILNAADCSTSLDHCVQAVGYDTSGSTPFWSVRNSWGANWGESGYIRLQYGKDTCGMADEATSSCINC